MLLQFIHIYIPSINLYMVWNLQLSGCPLFNLIRVSDKLSFS